MLIAALSVSAAAPAQQNTDLGKFEYENSCAVCHGVDAKGNGAYASYLKDKLASIFRSENTLNNLSQAIELHKVSGIDLEHLAIFRTKRLALRELLIRVTPDYEIPDAQEREGQLICSRPDPSATDECIAPRHSLRGARSMTFQGSAR